MKALVLFSGGQDSTVCLAWALSQFDHVETIGFNYNQRHDVEMSCRLKARQRIISEFKGWPGQLGHDHVLSLSALGEISHTALTRPEEIITSKTGLPNTFIPGRNLLFLTFAAAVAYPRKCRDLVTGVCETDEAGYPDCREATMNAMQAALSLGMDTQFVIHTPLISIDKAATWHLAEKLGGLRFVELIISETHTCYLGDRSKLHQWGYGCGKCPACFIRARGFQTYLDTR